MPGRATSRRDSPASLHPMLRCLREASQILCFNVCIKRSVPGCCSPHRCTIGCSTGSMVAAVVMIRLHVSFHTTLGLGRRRWGSLDVLQKRLGQLSPARVIITPFPDRRYSRCIRIPGRPAQLALLLIINLHTIAVLGRGTFIALLAATSYDHLLARWFDRRPMLPLDLFPHRVVLAQQHLHGVVSLIGLFADRRFVRFERPLGRARPVGRPARRAHGTLLRHERWVGGGQLGGLSVRFFSASLSPLSVLATGILAAPCPAVPADQL